MTRSLSVIFGHLTNWKDISIYGNKCDSLIALSRYYRTQRSDYRITQHKCYSTDDCTVVRVHKMAMEWKFWKYDCQGARGEWGGTVSGVALFTVYKMLL